MANNFTLGEVTALRAAALSAYTKALASREYKIGSRQLQNQDIDKLWAQVDKFDRWICALNGQSPISIRTLVPFDH